jgi:hypothetical protein
LINSGGMARAWTLLGAACVTLIARSSRAVDGPGPDDQAHPCRPTISCTADIVSPGSVEVEVGSQLSGVARGDRELAFPLLLKLTFTRLLQLQVGSNGYTTIAGPVPVHYFDNVILGPKLHLLDQGDIRPSLAITAQLSLPTVAERGYEQIDDAFFTGHASKDISFLHIDWNAGAYVWRFDDSPVVQGFTALALSTSLSSVIGVAAEAYYFSNAAPVVSRDGGFRGVLTATVRPWMVLDVGGDAGWFPSTRAYTFFFGMTLVPVVLWRPS